MRHGKHLLPLAIVAALTAGVLAQDIVLPNKASSLRFAVIGDTGSGDDNQYKLAKVFVDIRQKYPFEFVIMSGDNLVGGQSAKDYAKKFEIPYKGLLDQGVKFYAALGNHDQSNQVDYKLFNMNGKRYYTFKPKAGIRMFALDTNYMDKEQLAWLEKELAASTSDWKIVWFHHAIYSSGGTHGSDLVLRAELEPLFVKYGVDVVFAGHDHFYERFKPQKGIQYFVAGGGGRLRVGDIRKSEETAKGYDQGCAFMLIEVDGDQMDYQVVSDQGMTVDQGAVQRHKNGTASQ